MTARPDLAPPPRPGPTPDALHRHVLDALTQVPAPVDHARARHARAQLRRLAAALPDSDRLLTDPPTLAAVSAAVAVADPPLLMAMIVHHLMCLGSIRLLAGDPAELAHERAELESARRVGLFQVTEVGDAGSQLALQTVAELDPARREFRLYTPNARAMKISAVARDGGRQSAVVCARLRIDGVDRGVFSFLVDLCDDAGPRPGVEISEPLGVTNVPLGYALVRFTGAPIPYRRWLRDSAHIDSDGRFHDPIGDPGRRLRRTLGVGQTLWAALPSGMAAMARDAACRSLRHAAHRQSHGQLAPGRPTLVYRPQQRALLGAVADAHALGCAAREALRVWRSARPEGNGGRPAADASASSTATSAPWVAVDGALAVHKALAVRVAGRVVRECQYRSGLAGFLGPNRLPAYDGFAHAFECAGGDNRLILMDTGRALASRYADAATEPPSNSPSGTEPAPTPALPPEDPGWWPELARLRERQLAGRLGAELRRGARRGLAGLELWNPLLESALRLGEAHADRVAADSLLRHLPAANPDEPRSGMLRSLACLYGLRQAERHHGELVAAGLLDAAATHPIAAARYGHYDALLADLPGLVDAVGGADGGPAAPLGSADYAAALADAVTWHAGSGT